MAIEVTLVLRYEEEEDIPVSSWDDVEDILGPCVLIEAIQEEV